MSEFVWGRNTVLEALGAGRKIKKIVVFEGARSSKPVSEIVSQAETRGIPVEFAPRSRLDRISLHNQGVIAEVTGFKYSNLDEILAFAAQRGEMPLLLILDSVQDPQNMGSLLRTADAVGAHGVIIPKHRAVGVTPGVEKSSAGAVEYLKIAQVTNLAKTINDLKEKGIWVVGVESGAKTAYDEVDLNMAIALVMGSEGKGISRLVLESCDLVLSLPMNGHVSSLNVAVAGSIILYHAWRQRKKSSAK